MVTAALPYANGKLHIGHIAGAYLPADICVRFLRLKGRKTAFICGSDENGVAITTSANREGVSPQEIIDRYHVANENAFLAMGILFDYYGRTSDPKHDEMAQAFFLRHHEQGHVQKRSMEQPYCTACLMFLPDRYIEGSCHHCKAEGAKGDQCEICGKMCDATKLINPRCTLCGSRNIEIRSTDHWFFRLDNFEKQLQEYIQNHPHFRDNVRNFCENLLKQGLIPRAITRDIDWGIPVPLPDGENKVLYVWFDAPIGYVTFTKQFFVQQGLPEEWKLYWQSEECNILHFIGKDNIVFHAIVWPAMLMGHGDFQLPYDVVANEFLNISGKKISTSRNYAVWVDDYLAAFDPDPLRYYLTAIAPENSDADFTWEDFQTRNNSELADTLGNFMQRNMVFTQKYFAGVMPSAGELSEHAKGMLLAIEEARKEISTLLDRQNFKAALMRLMRLAQTGNQFLENEKPWNSRKSDMTRCGMAVHIGLRVVEALSVFMAPFLPFSSAKLRIMLSLPPLKNGDWDQPWKLKEGHQIGQPEILFRKFEEDEIAPHKEALAFKP